jgi:two-component system, OmpR family, phosphate regulon response regulator PhoB
MQCKERDEMQKILVVDDLQEVRDLVEKTLRMGDRVVIKTDSGDKAVQVARAEKPDLIMMDIMMPGTIDGLEATRILKSDPEMKNCTIILLTARGQEKDIEEGYKAGADDYLVKPFSPLELMRKVDALLG